VKFVRLHIHLESSSRALRLRIPEGSFRALQWGKRIVQLGLVLLILQVGTIFTYDYLIKSATRQQAKLFHQLKGVESQLHSLETDVRTSFRQEDLVHMKFGVVPPPKEERELGFGGTIPEDSAFLYRVHPVRGLQASILGQISQIDNQIDRSKTSFATISEYMEQQFNQLRHLPSISPAGGRFSSGFGLRTHPVTGEREKMHSGIDISNNRWTPIYATADGVVSLVKYQDFFGNYVVLNHGNGFQTKYGHMEKPIVKEGQYVKRYSVIGYMGRTGRTTGIHVHYEVWRGESAVNPVGYVLSPDYTVE